MFEVRLTPRSSSRLRTVAGDDGRRYGEVVDAARAALQGRRLWHINSTAEGGGVAELLRANLRYLAGDGIATRWAVIDGDPAFFEITKRIHNRLHGVLGDAGPLGEAERAHYDRTSAENAAGIAGLIRAGDVVVVHDPQPLGLVPALRAAGAVVIWTCHIGVDVANDVCRSAWEFLLADARAAHATSFTRRAYVWDGLDDARVHLIPPCIDVMAPKNVAIQPARRDAILRAAGVLARPLRSDRGHHADVWQDGFVPAGAPLVVQVSRWDALKDPAGVVRGFVEEPRLDRAHVLLAGPAPFGVADDPEAVEVLQAVEDLRVGLPRAQRSRVHLANLPTQDVVENARIVNALQRRADVVVQKSLAEGFGLTVTEAMWKARPVVAGGVGGIRDQIEDGVSGMLVDPRDLAAFGNAVARVLRDPAHAAAMGEEARRRVAERYLPTRYLGSYLELILDLLGEGAGSR
jgi:trehalose synthase